MNLRRDIVLACLTWTLGVGLSGGVSIKGGYDELLRQLRATAEMAFEKDLTFRRWNAIHGGVYVLVDEHNQPNPYLDVPDRDLVTETGKHLTRINPAYMTRQAHEIQKKNNGVQGHITSLTPIRPANAPDAWEKSALQKFQQGALEVSSREVIGGLDYFRFMRPMLAEKPCLKCHAKQGYAEGDIRGGISVTVPMGPQLAAFNAHAAKVIGGHAVVWALGMILAIFGGRRLGHSIRKEREARLEAEAASIAKGEFLANMSHEIRTPLNGVLGMLQLLKDKNTPEEQASYVDMAYDSGNRLLDLLNDVLDYSRVEAGELKIERQPFRTRDLLESAASVFRAACAKHGLGLDIVADPSLPEVLVGDEARLRQVLFNLLGNAIKFTPKGSVTVSAWARQQGRSGEVRLYLVVRDTGIGIPDDKLDHIFERFTQVDASRTRRYQGAGLGLAIVRRLVDLMDGTLTVESEPGAGTAFYVQVPLRQPESPLPAKPAEAMRQTYGAPPDAMRLLLVEDEEISRLSVQVMLTRLGYDVVCARNGLEAVENFRAGGGFQRVLMDVQMPLMNGLEATQAIREMEAQQGWPRTRIIALTAYAMPGDREQFLASGMDDCVTKPVQPETLLLALRKARSGAA